MLATLVLSAGSAMAAAGCSTQTSASSANESPGSALNDDRNAVAGPTLPSEDASPPVPAAYRGNPLCHLSSDKCMPDDDGYSAKNRLTNEASTCAEAPPDAGDATATTSYSPGCRITRDDTTNEVAPSCDRQVRTTPPGGDGASCEAGSDCAAGFDCIAGEKGAKACRHYCCSGTCTDHTSQSGGATFCDVQNLVDVNQKAPVCMPLKRCKLLGTGECTQNESCAVVTESGETGCVAIGPQQVGAPCDEDHCAANLTCVGKPGTRKCYKLCKVNSSDCGATQICATSIVFKDPNFGICQKP